MVGNHLAPLHGVAVLIRETLRVNAVGEYDGAAYVLYGPVDVGTQHESVVHHDRLVPGNPHAVTELGARVSVVDRVHCGCRPMSLMSFPYLS